MLNEVQYKIVVIVLKIFLKYFIQVNGPRKKNKNDFNASRNNINFNDFQILY